MTADGDIPHDKWDDFLAGFTGMHHRWLTNVVECDPEGATHLVAHEQPLERVCIERQAGHEVLAMTFGRGASPHEIRLLGPKRLWLSETADHAHRGLDVDATNGKRLRIRFRVAALPETVDGLP